MTTDFEARYRRIAEAIAWLGATRQTRPPLALAAEAAGLSPWHFQREFTRWTGVSPKRFQRLLALERAKACLRDRAPVLEAALEAGEEEAVIAAERARWPRATFAPDATVGADIAERLFARRGGATEPLRLAPRGTNFQVKVWQALLAVPPGAVVTYAMIARALGRPGAARAVGGACAANPIAVLIPCHRVLRASGALGGYAWGEGRKRALIAWEAGRDRDGPAWDGGPRPQALKPSTSAME